MAAGPIVFVDTPILLQAEDRADEARFAAARAWLRLLWVGRCGRLSTQVLHEFYVLATRRLTPAMPAGDARAEVRRYQRWQPWPVDHATVEAAWAVESRHRLPYEAALRVAAAQQQGCTHLLSDELDHGRSFDGVVVADPFRVGPETLSTPPR